MVTGNQNKGNAALPSSQGIGNQGVYGKQGSHGVHGMMMPLPGMQMQYGGPGMYGAGSMGGMPGSFTPQPVGSYIPGPPAQTGVNPPGLLPVEESYIENILRLNLGKMATIYMTFENNSQWNAKMFKGRLEAAGRDHIIISDPKTGMRNLLLMVNLDYITFDEELAYTYSFGAQ